MPEADAVVVGAGIAGLYAIHRLRSLGLRVQCLEAGGDVGGTWYWNRYPGARCDVESIDYSYSFDPDLEQEWDWSERYATQPEILRYLRHVADRHDLRRSITFGTRVTSARFDEQTARWTVSASGTSGCAGTAGTWSARFLVLATGALSDARMPDLPGLDDFAGRRFHTARWPHEDVDFTGRRVGVIGTGSSGIQVTPMIARDAARLHVFQRSPNFSVPASNRPHTPATRAAYKATYAERRRKSRESGGGSPHDAHPKNTLEATPEERNEAFERQWELGGVLFSKTFPDQLKDEAANAEAVAFFNRKVRALIDDPAVADRLVPDDHPIGTKRICTDSGYYATFNRPNVTLVDLRSAPIQRITPEGIRTADADYPLDDIVFATGFDAMTGALSRIDLRGRGGLRLREEWAGGPRTYLGLMAAGFPNLFVVTGPGSPSVLANMVLAAEHHVDWIAGAVTRLDSRGLATIEPARAAQDEWVAYCDDLAAQTLMPRAGSWYMGANIPGKPRVFMPFVGGLGLYRRLVAEAVADGYRGFDFR